MSVKLKKKDGVLAVPTSSMGDIAFLLIIFFMLTSKFMQESHIEFKEPESADSQSVEDQTVSIVIDKDAQVWLQGEKSSPEALKYKLEELGSGDKDFTVMFKVDGGLPVKDITPVVEKISEAGAKITFVGRLPE